jgi:hypothetical protein
VLGLTQQEADVAVGAAEVVADRRWHAQINRVLIMSSGS